MKHLAPITALNVNAPNGHRLRGTHANGSAAVLITPESCNIVTGGSGDVTHGCN